jgi:putative glutamine amidotransferase
MKPRIAIPIPTSTDLVYNQRSWPMYAEAVTRSGGEPIEIPLKATPTEIANLINTCQAVLLPGSPADVNPHKYGQDPIPECSPADNPRENVDELLIQDAHNLYKPILAICFGLQSLNVWRGGTLVQDLSILPVNHPAGRSVAVAHTAAVAPDSLLGTVIASEEAPEQDGFLRLPINSSHHQAIGIPGDGLRVSARCRRRPIPGRHRSPLRPRRPMAPRAQLRHQPRLPGSLPPLRRRGSRLGPAPHPHLRRLVLNKLRPHRVYLIHSRCHHGNNPAQSDSLGSASRTAGDFHHLSGVAHSSDRA